MFNTEQNGGSSSGPNQDLFSVHASAIWSSICSLDIDFSSTTSLHVLELLQSVTCSELSFPINSDLIQLVLTENCVFIDDELARLISHYLYCKWTNTVGRKAARDSIKRYFEDSSAQFHSPPAGTASPRADFPIPSVDYSAHLNVPTVKSDRSAVPLDMRFDDYLQKCHIRATQITKNLNVFFDGTSNIERYFIWKHQVHQAISACDVSSHIPLETILCCLRGSALEIARNAINVQRLYETRGSEATAALWLVLDQSFSNDNARRYISQLFFSIKQGNTESVSNFLARFRSVAQMFASTRPSEPLHDEDLIIRLSLGLTSKVALLARGLIEAQKISNFDQYAIQLLNSSNSLHSFDFDRKYSNSIPNNSAQTSQSPFGKTLTHCSRCAGDHPIEECTKSVKFPCRLCRSDKHFTRACPKAQLNKSKFKGSNRSAYQSTKPVDQNSCAGSMPDLDLIAADSDSSTLNVVLVNNNSSRLDHRLIDQMDNQIELIVHSQSSRFKSPIPINCLLDSGAAASFVRKDVAVKLCEAGMIRKCHIKKLSTPVTVIYGNNQSEKISTYVSMNVAAPSGSQHTILAFVTDACNYGMILGRPGLRTLSLMPMNQPSSVVENSETYDPSNFEGCLSPVVSNSVQSVGKLKSFIQSNSNSDHLIAQSESFIQSDSNSDMSVCQSKSSLQLIPCPNSASAVEDVKNHFKSFVSICPKSNRILITHPILEDAVIVPYRCPKRCRSIIDQRIIYTRLMTMVDEGKVSIARSDQCRFIQEVVLVDKLKNGPRIHPDPTISKRYRLTLDSRVLNEMQILVTDNMTSFIPRTWNIPEGDDSFQSQHQYSAFETLRWIHFDLNTPCMFGKIDLSDAYQTILISESLKSLFCYACQTEQGVIYFRWNTLPQGWKFSPLYFSISIEYILGLCETELSQIGACARHFQDDILVKASNKLIVNSAVAIIGKKLNAFAFKVNMDKTEIGNSTTFCGIFISSHGFSPLPRCPLTSALIDSQWSQVVGAKNKDKKINALQQITGRFNYLRGFLPGKLMLRLQNLYSACSDLTQEKEIDIDSLKSDYDSVCQFILGGSFLLSYGLMSSALYTVVVTDANCAGYSAILYRLCRSSGIIQNTNDIIPILIRELNMENNSRLTLIPLRVIGQSFSKTEQKQSSTYRERLAQLYAIDSFYSLIDTPCIMVSDNQNTGRVWNNVDEYLTHGEDSTLNKGSLFTSWVRFIATVHKIIWVPRNSDIVSLCDEMARAIPRLSPNPSFVSKPSQSQPNSTSAVHSNSAIVDSAQTANSEFGTDQQIPSKIPRIASQFRIPIMEGYSVDTTTYCNVKMVSIHALLTHAVHCDVKATNLSRRFFLKDDILYHVNFNGDAKIYIPSCDISSDGSSQGSIRGHILSHFHDEAVGAHRGHKKLVFAISDIFWWPTLIVDCLHYVKTCVTCVEKKSTFTRFQGDLRSTVGNIPFSTLVIDYAGPIESNYILVVVCAFSGFCSLITSDDCTASSTALSLFQVISQWGIPKLIASDRGSSFVNNVISELGKLLGWTWKYSASYSPRSQGLAERLVQTIKAALSAIDTYDLPLKTALGMIQLFHNTSSTGSVPFSPYEIVFGRSTSISPFIESVDSTDPQDSFLQMAEIRALYSAFRDFMRSRVHDNYAARSPLVKFNVNDKVYRVYLTGKKGSPKAITGPHKIEKVFSDDRYSISDYQYPIPGYQLKQFPARDPSLSASSTEAQPLIESSSSAPVDSRNFKSGDLILHETHECGEISYDVSRIDMINFESHNLIVTRFWYDQKRCWNIWEGETNIVTFEKVVHHPLHLINKKVPRNVLNRIS